MIDIANAHQHWDREWAHADARSGKWAAPEARVTATAAQLHASGARRALDLGCGIGRHALALAAMGFDTEALDAAPAGLAVLREEAAERGLAIAAHQGAMHKLPFADASFDYIVSWNVIYHGDGAVVRACLDEIRRVLKPGGLYQGTMLSKRNVNFGVGTEVAPDTWINPAKSDKAHAHFYCSAVELAGLLEGFEPLLIEDREHEPGAWHWHVIATRI